MTTALTHTQITPAGAFTTITADDELTVLAAGWTADTAQLLPQVHSTLRPTLLRVAELKDIDQAVGAYHSGDLDVVNSFAVHQESGPFMMHAWKVLRMVPAGAPITYSEYASRSGRPLAIRAAATACARNAAALFVPCHRVLRLDGSLGGFRWSLPVKQWLLDHESQRVADTSVAGKG
ncbi:methylated-DNA--[protein]-cysteine S-methyltransferase [Nakamurella antarctica]|uniref:Methylated-DNA--[protein]-cysteine S-methyltransferase n=1 Tax=Nakamurella antarctica TaxID=1902245 RepID=A0A3G8ZJ54_9ACTN|nr:methylated-DNA--[protein]-cysteine S-methyltransferase [Nakamurella antarctica]AZI57402.1 methylated-DNA--[protein]-cysteine S-methyltransferase [Nakamurella antarctica]